MIIQPPNTNLIINADCLTALKELPDNSVDSIVTDPPYGLSFMGKKWDYEVPSIEIWKECLRVLKPGGYLLSFSGTRTYHRICIGIEDAGFEIRDMISWLYGSGFPKSFNVAKGIEGTILRGNSNTTEFRKLKGETQRIVNGYTKMENEQGNKPRNYNDRNGESVIKPEFETEEAKQYEGFGTALKPACEPIVVARKPLSEKNVALNCLNWGTGGINIDGCRVGTEEHRVNVNDFSNQHGNKFGNNMPIQKLGERMVTGRFPANIILDEEAGKILDEQTLGKVGNGHWAKTKVTGFGEFGNGKSEYFGVGEKDKEKGGASRFFYCAKASKSERNLGCEELDESNVDYGERMGQNNSKIRPDGTERKSNIQKNNHPTVKPIKLMQYLVRLVTPKGGICLDPFLGSGTTACACIKEGMNYIGIEREEDYVKIANARIKAVEDSQQN